MRDFSLNAFAIETEDKMPDTYCRLCILLKKMHCVICLFSALCPSYRRNRGEYEAPLRNIVRLSSSCFASCWGLLRLNPRGSLASRQTIAADCLGVILPQALPTYFRVRAQHQARVRGSSGTTHILVFMLLKGELHFRCHPAYR